jgi:hypothetical protein
MLAMLGAQLALSAVSSASPVTPAGRLGLHGNVAVAEAAVHDAQREAHGMFATDNHP